jgi:hypothetical protein
MTVPGRDSGALMQRPATLRLGPHGLLRED